MICLESFPPFIKGGVPLRGGGGSVDCMFPVPVSCLPIPNSYSVQDPMIRYLTTEKTNVKLKYWSKINSHINPPQSSNRRIMVL